MMVQSKHIRQITRYNMGVVVNTIPWALVVTIGVRYLYRQNTDFFMYLILPCICGLKLTQNFLFCALEGQRRGLKWSFSDQS